MTWQHGVFYYKQPPGDGTGAAAMQMRNIANKAYYAGQQPPMGILNPAAWGEFIKAWKRGDYKKKILIW